MNASPIIVLLSKRVIPWFY